MDIFNTNKNIKLFINVGGGIASLGSNKNANQLASGLQKDIKIKDIPDNQGIVYEMVNKNIPILNLLHLSKLMHKYELPNDPVPLPEVGEGKLYKAYKYDLTVVITATCIFMVLIIAVMLYDKKQNALGTQIIKTQ